MTVSLEAYLVFVALLVGSFINLAVDRLPRGESIVGPRSHCRSCGRVLNLVDLIPVAGYLVRRGRCASCGASIGPSSPVVEGLAGAVMLIPMATLGVGWGAVVGGVAVALLGAAALTVSFARNQAPARRGSRLG